MMGAMTARRARIGRLDIAIAVVGCVLAVAYQLPDHYNAKYDTPLLAAPFLAVLAVPLLWRRVAPLGALLGLWGALVGHYVIFGEVVRCGFVLPLVLLFAFQAGSRLDGRRSLLGLAVVWAIDLTICLTDGPLGAPLAAMTFLVPLGLGVWGTGRLVRSRAGMVRKLQASNEALRVARDERARLEVATDRARLSAQLDELLHRRLGELAQLADAGARSDDAGAATATLAEIERESRRTLEEMRSVVGVLRHDDAGAPASPQPTLTHLDALLVRAKGAGAQLTVYGNPRALPAGVELSAYRVVESLLDALQDADGVEVIVRFSDDALELTVSGPARRHGEGAFERARERARLHSGTLQTSVRGGRAEAVVSLPLFATV
jgi:hypothetical protein